MSLGFNSNVTVAGVVYHVQTEARAGAHSVLDTVVYVSGRVIHRVKTNYQDLLDRGGSPQELRDIVERHHLDVVSQVEKGQVRDVAPPAAVPLVTTLEVRLLNPSSWLLGGNAAVDVSVGDPDGKPVEGAKVEVLIESSAKVAAQSSSLTDATGRAVLHFEMPAPMPEGAALVLRAALAGARGELRYKLKARPGGAS